MLVRASPAGGGYHSQPDNLRQAGVDALAYRASLNEDLNTAIMELLGTVKGTLAQAHARSCTARSSRECFVY